LKSKKVNQVRSTLKKITVNAQIVASSSGVLIRDAAALRTCDSYDIETIARYLLVSQIKKPGIEAIMSRKVFQQTKPLPRQKPLTYIARIWYRFVLRTRPIMADNNNSRTRISQTNDPFHALPTELLASILDRLTARERCYLRLQSTHIRSFVDKYEEAKSISLYVRDSARTPQPWDSILSLARVDLRAELTRLACEYAYSSTKRDYHHHIARVIATTLHDLSKEAVLDIRAPAPASVIHAILDMHHVQRLLAGEERRGLRLDEKLIAAQKAIRARLVSIYGLERHVIWPIDIATGHPSHDSRAARADIEEVVEP
jgi:hypothetical protein